MAPNNLSCPFCNFSDSDEYFLMLHIEELHTDDSPFIVKDSPPIPAADSKSPFLQSGDQQFDGDRDDPSEGYVACPEGDCGEDVLLSDLNEHLDFHLAERVTLDEQDDSSLSSSSSNTKMQSSPEHSSSFIQSNFSTSISPSLRHAKFASSSSSSDSVNTPSKSAKRRDEEYHRHKKARREPKSSDPVRLGRRELGPHAWEERMPEWLWKKLLAGPKITKKTTISRSGTLLTQEVVENETPGLVPVLARLSALDRDVVEAFYCHPAVIHIFSLPKEGGFCGYRNIQMLVSYLQGAKAFGYEKFPGRLPNIPELQNAIEHAWDLGLGTISRQQTGGIKGTRKYIGTPEVGALFDSLNIPVIPEQVHSHKEGPKAYQLLLDLVEAYFTGETLDEDSSGKRRVHETVLAPIYLQQPGHSVTIVGLERRRDGSRNLVVFDPMYKTAPALVKLVGRTKIDSPHPAAMDSFRRGMKNLERHESFEMMKLISNSPRIPVWGILSSFLHTPYVYVFFDLKTESYDVYRADAFHSLFPWFMYGGLFIVREGRFARVPGDASFDRLGVPALGFDCDWASWKKEKDVVSLVLCAAETKARKNCFTGAIFGSWSGWQQQSTPLQPFPIFDPSLVDACSCWECAGSLIERNLRQLQHMATHSSISTVTQASRISSPPASSTSSWCSCWECRSNASFTPDSSRSCVAFDTNSNNWSNSNASVALNQHQLPITPTVVSPLSPLSTTSTTGCSCPPGFHTAFCAPSRFPDTSLGSWGSNAPSLTNSSWSPKSSYGPMTPYGSPGSCSSASQQTYPSSPLSGSSGNTSRYANLEHITRFRGYGVQSQVYGTTVQFAAPQWASIDETMTEGRVP